MGKISDYQSILELVDGDAAIAAKLEHAMKRKVKDFRREWQAFDADGQLKDWKQYLGKPAGKARSAKASRNSRAG